MLSVSKHGPYKVISDRLQGLFEQYEVDAYFCGHDHNLQYLRHNDVEYYVVGAGQFIDSNKTND